jgi:hypothetical protein
MLTLNANVRVCTGKHDMTRAVAAICAIVAVALQLVIVCCTSTQAQMQTAPPESTIWDHNGSVMYLVVNGSSREIFYQKPRPGMLAAGARSGSLLFRGEINNGQYLGTAYIFNLQCGPVPYEAKGPILNDEERIVLTGQAPRVGRDCRAYGSHTSNLEFRRLRTNELAQSQEPLTAAPSAGEPKAELPSTNGGELPSAPTPRPSVEKEPVAGKDSLPLVADPKVPSTPIAEASMTNETPRAKDLHNYVLGAAFIVMAVWLSIVLFGKSLIRRIR